MGGWTERVGRRFPRASLAFSGLWSSFFGMSAAFGVTDIASGSDTALLPAMLGLTFLLGIAALPWPLARAAWREWRGKVSEDRHLAAAIDRAAADQAAAARRERLPEDVRETWRRLDEALAVLDDLADRGWVDPRAPSEVRVEADHLGDILDADRRTQQIGGEASTGPRDDLEDLLHLVVALCDEAVDHRHAKNADGRVPARLVDARERLAAEAAAHRELRGEG